MVLGYRRSRYAFLTAAVIAAIAGALGWQGRPQNAQRPSRRETYPARSFKPDAVTREIRSGSRSLFRVLTPDENARMLAADAGKIVGDHGAFVFVSAKDDSGLTAAGIEFQNVETSINLPGRVFDPVKTPPAGTVPSGVSFAPEGEGYYIVQFGETANDELLDSLKAAGIEVLQYVPHQAFFVYGTGESIAAAANHSRVRWVGRFLPEHKISEVLRQQLVAAKTRRSPGGGVSRVELTDKRTAVFDVAVFKHADIGSASKRIIGASGGRLVNAVDLPGNFFNLVRIEASVDLATRIAEVPEVIRIDAAGTPEKEDERAAQIVAGNYSSATVLNGPGYDPLTQFGVNGQGVSVSVVDDGVGIPGDGGFYITAGNAIDGPLRGAGVGASGHGHLNASIIAGDTPFSVLDPTGYNYGLGVAPKANIINIPFLVPGYTGTEADTANDTVTTAGPNGVRGFISNNSWGNGTNGNAYDSYAAQYDGFARDASAATSIDPLLFVFSAGNSGSSGLTRPKMAKNVIAVANLENVRTELSASANNIDDLNSSSSIGPAADSRIKPDIAAPGTAITGGRSGPSALFGNIDAAHRWSSGTSHAAPQVAGAAALFTQFWKAGHGGLNPSPSLTKAAIINSGRDANGVGTAAAIPNAGEGWGRVNLKNMLNTGAAITYVNETDVLGGTGAVKEYNGNVADPGRPVRVSLVWTDPPGVGDPALVNDLDLEVIVGGNTYKGNVLSGGLSIVGGSADRRNNVENVFLPAGVSGPIMVRVLGTAINGDGILGNSDPTDQHFSLVINNAAVAVDTSAFLAAGSPSIASGNGLVEPNECNQIYLPLTNYGETAATGITAELSTTTPGVTISVSNVSYPDLAPGATALNSPTFVFSTDNTVACFTSIDLTMTVTFTGGQSPKSYNFSIPVGVPAGTNYNFAASAGAVISAGGTLVAGSNADDVPVNFTAPFAFSVYGTNVAAGSAIRLSTNGNIRIETAGSANSGTNNTTLPSADNSFPASLPVLMPYWDDLDMSPTVTSGGGIYSEVTGAPGSQTLKLEWRAKHWTGVQIVGPPDTNFAVYFHENSNSFEYVYALTGAGANASGASATVGIQAARTGTTFTQFSANSASLSPGLMLSASIPAAACSAGPGGCVVTAAPVAVSGRVISQYGRGIKNAMVTLTDGAGGVRMAITNSFGYFRFDNVPSGQSYAASVTAKGYRFEAQMVDLTDSVSNLNFTPLP